ncbi:MULTISPECIES: cytidine deaminase [Dermacoccus]|uniref:cytidine deaminase n=1 Tax=Dermacoccus TaxID=57495 RepID=UPI00210821CF|nr:MULTISPECIES: cytidine deaminase [Dermacoccus]MBZ4496718.1 cytidine deaminase [Dermacoccus sp. Tok2021]MCT1986357.1 cytidine deaminase [Dermacoccus abyssi]
MSDNASATASTGQSPRPSVDWELLRGEAVAVCARAYVPYSRFPVGVAALTTRGRILTGCNVENAAYGVVLCAECGLVSSLYGTGESRGDGPVLDHEAERELLVALSCVDGNGTPITPCGRCRQLLFEHASPDMLIEMDGGPPLPLTDLLPHAFGAPNLGAVATAAATLKGDS